MVVARDGYTILDILSDVGGIESILITGIGLALQLWNYKHFDSHMVSQLYKRPDAAANGQSGFKPTKCGNIKLFCIDHLPRKVTCCRLNEREKAMEQAMQKLNQETDIVLIVRRLRLYLAALKDLLHEERIAAIEEQVEFACFESVAKLETQKPVLPLQRAEKTQE